MDNNSKFRGRRQIGKTENRLQYIVFQQPLSNLRVFLTEVISVGGYLSFSKAAAFLPEESQRNYHDTALI